MNGIITPSWTNGDYWADSLYLNYNATYSGSNISNSGHLFTVRFKSNVNSKKSVFENTSTIINFNSNLNYTVAVIGDVNDDGFVDEDDKTLVQQYSLSLITFDNRQKIAADVNFDGVVNMSDAVAILQYYSGSINSFF